MHKFIGRIFILCSFHFITLVSMGAVKLPSLISNNMVLQQNSEVALWGWADPGEKVVINTSWNNKITKVSANNSGKWITYVKTSSAGGPYTIIFQASNEIKVENVLLGEVWLASGQSNMEFFVGKMKSSSYTGVINYQEEIKSANYPLIRQIDVPNKNAAEPKEDFTGSWNVCSPQTVDTFSAVAYYFALQLYKNTGYPVGIINSTWGGTAAESWTKREVLEADKDLRVTVSRYDSMVKNYPAALEKYNAALQNWKLDSLSKPKPSAIAKPNNDKAPFRLYNGMIAPLIPYTLKGIIWYQGESNADRAYQYRTLFPAMIRSWRSDFKNEKLPFYFVQISPHRSQNAEIRDAQLFTYRSVPNTGMVVTTDNGDSLNIHPRDKKLVGDRLSLWALHNEYGKKDVIFSGPLFRSMKSKGNKIILHFDYAESGLVAQNGELKEFIIAGDDQKFVPATAVIEGDEVIVWSNEIKKPVAVRFAWKNVPHPNLYNKAGLPASPFRTDNWPVATQGKN